MEKLSLPLSRLVHENLSIVMCFAYSRLPLQTLIERKFVGYWEYLEKAVFEISASRAEKACLELALFLRVLDDEEGLSQYYESVGSTVDCGRLVTKNGVKPLQFRDVANKIIHCSRLDWQFSSEKDPVLICRSRDEERWLCAEVNLVALAAVCGRLMS